MPHWSTRPGGQALLMRDSDGRRFEVVHGDTRRTPDTPPPKDQPQRLAHAVLNAHAVGSTQAFLEQALGFVLADRTRIMAFMNCDADHHTLALGDTDNDALNHIAFLMPTLDAVMRGGGRMKDAGHAIEWGPGRHGPGDNAFNYFIDPFGIVIEYTAEVEQVDDSHRAGQPADWTWPPAGSLAGAGARSIVPPAASVACATACSAAALRARSVTFTMRGVPGAACSASRWWSAPLPRRYSTPSARAATSSRQTWV